MAGVAGAVGTADGDEYAPWDDQLIELGYRLFANSNINVIQGLNLSKEQAVELRALALEVESRGIERPVFRGRLAPQVAVVREAFMVAEKALGKGREVTTEIEEVVREARAIESGFLRAGLTAPVPGEKYASCRRCHAEPRIEEGRISYGPLPDKWETLGKKATSQAIKKEMAAAHLGAVLRDKKGFELMIRMAPRVSKILKPNQRTVVGEFSCCLIPPKSLDDPVRVGQADTGGWEADMFDKLRACPDSWWPTAKKRTLDKLAEAALIKDPGMTEEKIAKERKRLGELFEKVRSLSDLDFEMEKKGLAARVNLGPPAVEERFRDFNAAFFLLLPGSAGVYDKLIEGDTKRNDL